ncbi:MAG: hypothetical protein ABIP12_00245, partial [Terriglobales bacterium]
MNSSLRLSRLAMCLGLVIAAATSPAAAQSKKLAHDGSNDSAAGRAVSSDITAKPVVPRLIKYNGAFRDASGAPRVGSVGVVFALYAEPTGGAPLWQETQNVQLDGQGRYNVLLGSARELPAEIFSSNGARWLGVQVMADAEPELARTLLVSVAYALKSQDAETLGGVPASAYVLRDTVKNMLEAGMSQRLLQTQTQAAAKSLDSGTVNTSVAHTVNAIPKFSAPDTLADSMLIELYNQPAADAFGFALANEDVVRIGDGTGLRKSLHLSGRVVAQGFDMNTSEANSLHIVNTNPNGIGLQANADGAGFATGIFGSARSFNGAGLTAFSFPPIGGGSPAPADYSVAAYTGNFNQQGVGVHAWSAFNGTPQGDDFPILTGPIGLYAAAAHSTGIPAVIDQRATAGGTILSARAQGAEVISMTTAGNITATGTISANAFSGDGSALTNVNASTATNATNALNLGGVAAADYALETYADAGDAATLTSANTYTDTQVATEATARAAGDATNASAISAGDAATLTSANTYTDTQVATEATARAAGDATNASAITAGDAATLTSANAYTDTQVATEATARATGDATNTSAITAGDAATLTSANTYTDAQVAAEATARAAGDATNASAITAETTARIAADGLDAKLAGGNIFTGGKQTFAPATAAAASVNIDGGAAPTTPVQGDIWNEGGVLKVFNGTTTKTLAFTDSTLSGNAATATALAANGANCASGFALGVDEVGAAECGTNGSALTGLNASNLASGTVPAGRLSGSYGIDISGNAATATSATNFSGSLVGDVTGTQSATVVSSVGGQTAVNVASATTAANAATNANTVSTIVKRDASGNFSAGTITASLTGNVSGNAGTVTNGVYTSASYADPAFITALAGSKISGNISGSAAALTNNPADCAAGQYATTIAANGNLTCASIQASELPSLAGSYVDLTTGQSIAGTKTFTSLITGSITGNAGTVTNGVYTSGSYADPAFITSLAGSKISGNILGNAANVTGTV